MNSNDIIEAIDGNSDCLMLVRDELRTMIAVSEDSKIIHRVVEQLNSIERELELHRELKLVELALQNGIELEAMMDWLRREVERVVDQ